MPVRAGLCSPVLNTMRRSAAWVHQSKNPTFFIAFCLCEASGHLYPRRIRIYEVLAQHIDLLHVLTVMVIPKLVDQLQSQLAQAFIARVTEVLAAGLPAVVRRIGKYF